MFGDVSLLGGCVDIRNKQACCHCLVSVLFGMGWDGMEEQGEIVQEEWGERERGSESSGGRERENTWKEGNEKRGEMRRETLDSKGIGSFSLNSIVMTVVASMYW